MPAENYLEIGNRLPYRKIIFRVSLVIYPVRMVVSLCALVAACILTKVKSPIKCQESYNDPAPMTLPGIIMEAKKWISNI